MMEGDLVHIPQDVYMHTNPELTSAFIRTDKPTTGIVLKHSIERRLVEVFANGSHHFLADKNAYPLERLC